MRASDSIVPRFCVRFEPHAGKRGVRKRSAAAEEIIALAIEAVRTLEIPHFDPIDDEVVDGEVIH